MSGRRAARGPRCWVGEGQGPGASGRVCARLGAPAPGGSGGCASKSGDIEGGWRGLGARGPPGRAAYVPPRSIQPGCICAATAAGWVRALTLERPLAEGGARGPRRSLGPQPSSDGLRDRPGLNGAAGEVLRLPAPKPPSVRPRAG